MILPGFYMNLGDTFIDGANLSEGTEMDKWHNQPRPIFVMHFCFLLWRFSVCVTLTFKFWGLDFFPSKWMFPWNVCVKMYLCVYVIVHVCIWLNKYSFLIPFCILSWKQNIVYLTLSSNYINIGTCLFFFIVLNQLRKCDTPMSFFSVSGRIIFKKNSILLEPLCSQVKKGVLEREIILQCLCFESLSNLPLKW